MTSLPSRAPGPDRWTGPPPAVPRVREWVQRTDPGLTRAQFAAKAVLALVLGGGGAAALLAALGGAPRTGAAGGLLAMIGLLTVQSGPLRARLMVVMRMALVAVPAAALGAALTPWPLASRAGVLVLMAAAAVLTHWGPAGVAMGMAGFLAYFFALFLHLTPDQAPAVAVAAVVGYAGLALVLTAWPERGRARRLVPGFRARVLHVVDVARRDAMRPPPERPSRRTRHALVAATAAVQEVALQIEDALEAPRAGVADPARLQDHVFVAELLADHLAAAAIAAAERGQGRDALLAELARPVSIGTEAPATTDLLPPAAGAADRTAGLVERLARAVASVETAAARPAGPVIEAPAPALDLVGDDGAPRPDVDPTVRRVVQVTVAGALSLGVGLWLSETYWPYAVLAAFVTLLTMPDRGASLRRAADRVLGTALGVAGGMAAAAALTDAAKPAEIALLLPLLLLAFWALAASYAAMIGVFTFVLALIYDLQGADTAALLSARLWETAAGAGLGAAVAFVVLPRRTRDATAQGLASVLGALDALLATLDPDAAPAAGVVYGRLRAFDRAAVAFRAAGQPLASGLLGRLGGRASSDARRDLFLSASLRYRVRMLVTAVVRPDGIAGPVPADAVPLLDGVRGRARRLRRVLTGAEPLPPIRPIPAEACVPGPAATALRGIDERLASWTAENRPRGRP